MIPRAHFRFNGRAALVCVCCAISAPLASASDNPREGIEGALHERPDLSRPAAAWRGAFEHAFGDVPAPCQAGLDRAAEVLPRLRLAIAGELTRMSVASSLADYAAQQGAEPERFETFAAAARRLLTATPDKKIPVEAMNRWLHESAELILEAVASAKAIRAIEPDSQQAALLRDLSMLAHVARFHAYRSIGAVRYNLFKRSQRLAELVASVADEKLALKAWQDVVAALGPVRDSSWHAELRDLDFWVKDLEAQCCPPDEAVLREKVWQPFANPPPKR